MTANCANACRQSLSSSCFIKFLPTSLAFFSIGKNHIPGIVPILSHTCFKLALANSLYLISLSLCFPDVQSGFFFCKCWIISCDPFSKIKWTRLSFLHRSVCGTDKWPDMPSLNCWHVWEYRPVDACWKGPEDEPSLLREPSSCLQLHDKWTSFPQDNIAYDLWCLPETALSSFPISSVPFPSSSVINLLIHSQIWSEQVWVLFVQHVEQIAVLKSFPEAHFLIIAQVLAKLQKHYTWTSVYIQADKAKQKL